MGGQHLSDSGRGNQFPVKPKISPDRCIVSHTDIYPGGIESFGVGTLLTSLDTNSTNKVSAIHASTRNITTTNLAPYKPTMTSHKQLAPLHTHVPLNIFQMHTQCEAQSMKTPCRQRTLSHARMCNDTLSTGDRH